MDCDNISSLESNDFCYLKAKNLLGKIKQNKNFCITKDDCTISFDNLNPPTAEIDELDDLFEKEIGNKEVTVYCYNTANSAHSVFNDAGDFLQDSANLDPDSTFNSFTIGKDVFKTTVRLINTTEATEKKAIDEAQKQLDLLAENYAVMSLNCVFGNDKQQESCGDIKDDENNTTITGITDSKFQVLGYLGTNNIVAVNENAQTLTLSVNSLINDLKLSNSDLDLQSSNLLQTLQDNDFSKKLKSYKDAVNGLAIQSCWLQLKCEYQNLSHTLNCPDVSIANGAIYDIYSALSSDEGSEYSDTSTIDAGEFTQSVNANQALALLPEDLSVITPEKYEKYYDTCTDNCDRNNDLKNTLITKYNENLLDSSVPVVTNENDSYSSKFYDISDYESFLGEKNTYTETEKYNEGVIESLETRAWNAVINNQECYYGNKETTLYCCNESPDKYANCIPAYPELNLEIPSWAPSYFVTEVAKDIKTDSKVNIDKNQFISKAIPTTDSRTGAITKEDALTAVKESSELAANYANLQLEYCGYYSHRMYLHCDKGKITNPKQEFSDKIKYAFGDDDLTIDFYKNNDVKKDNVASLTYSFKDNSKGLVSFNKKKKNLINDTIFYDTIFSLEPLQTDADIKLPYIFTSSYRENNTLIPYATFEYDDNIELSINDKYFKPTINQADYSFTKDKNTSSFTLTLGNSDTPNIQITQTKDSETNSIKVKRLDTNNTIFELTTSSETTTPSKPETFGNGADAISYIFSQDNKSEDPLSLRITADNTTKYSFTVSGDFISLNTNLITFNLSSLDQFTIVSKYSSNYSKIQRDGSKLTVTYEDYEDGNSQINGQLNISKTSISYINYTYIESLINLSDNIVDIYSTNNTYSRLRFTEAKATDPNTELVYVPYSALESFTSKETSGLENEFRILISADTFLSESDWFTNLQTAIDTELKTNTNTNTDTDSYFINLSELETPSEALLEKINNTDCKYLVTSDKTIKTEANTSIDINKLKTEFIATAYEAANIVLFIYNNNYVNKGYTLCLDHVCEETSTSSKSAVGDYFAVKKSSILYSWLNYGSVNSLNNNSYVNSLNNDNPYKNSQYDVDSQALNQLTYQVSCLYGNLALPQIVCSQHTSCSGWVDRRGGNPIQGNTIVATSPEEAQDIAKMLQLGSINCLCQDLTGGSDYPSPDSGCSQTADMYVCGLDKTITVCLSS